MSNPVKPHIQRRIDAEKRAADMEKRAADMALAQQQSLPQQQQQQQQHQQPVTVKSHIQKRKDAEERAAQQQSLQQQQLRPQQQQLRPQQQQLRPQQQQLRPQQQENPVFFWLPYARNGFLSNWFRPADFVDPKSKLKFSSSEQFYMAAKAAIAGDKVNFMEIMYIDEPEPIKKIGRLVKSPNMTESDFKDLWDQNQVPVMEVACYLKFSQNPDLKRALLSTDDAKLAEASPYDTIWGIGIREEEAKLIHPDNLIPGYMHRGKALGNNYLGRVLMNLREQLREGPISMNGYAADIIPEFLRTLPQEEIDKLPIVPVDEFLPSSEQPPPRHPPRDDELEDYIKTHYSREDDENIDDKNNAVRIAFSIERKMAAGNTIDERVRVSMRENLADYIRRRNQPQQQHRQQQFRPPPLQEQFQPLQEQFQPPPPPPQEIHSMGFDENLVRRALEIYKGNEQQAIEAILAGTVIVEEHREPESDSVLEGKLKRFDKKLVMRALTQANSNKAEAIKILVTNEILFLLKTTNGLEEIDVGNGLEKIDRNMVVNVLRRFNNDKNSTEKYLLSLPRPEKIYTEEERYIMNMTIVDNRGGGNCLFTTLVGSLQNLFIHLKNQEDFDSVPRDEALMRQAIVNFERENYDEEIFYPSVSPIDAELSGMDSLNTTILSDQFRGVRIEGKNEPFETVEEYFDLMQQNRAYGTHIELMAAAIMFNVDILVEIQTNSTFLRYASQVERQHERIIYIFKNDDSGHYSWKNPYGQRAGKQKQQKQQKSCNMNCKKLSKRYSRYNKKLYKYSSPTQAQKMATKYLGKTAKLYPANNPVKKYRICDPVSKKWVNFGQLGYEDYTRHKNKTRRHNYLTRTANMRGDWKSNKYSANNLSRRVLWG
jgi:ribA/ribD-fused uncharacterized protein